MLADNRVDRPVANVSSSNAPTAVAMAVLLDSRPGLRLWPAMVGGARAAYLTSITFSSFQVSHTINTSVRYQVRVNVTGDHSKNTQILFLIVEIGKYIPGRFLSVP